MDTAIEFVGQYWDAIALAVAAVGAIVIASAAHRAAIDLAVRAERDACAETVASIRVMQTSASWLRGAEWMQNRAAESIRARGSHKSTPAARSASRPEPRDLRPAASSAGVDAGALSHDLEHTLRRN